jgi:pyruvate dehydrogenase E2 component (dihydrolipoamide acetyltransferase)
MKELKFVDVGEGITEGHIHKWMVKDGDGVKEDQTIVQVETDKAVVNVPSPISGKVKIVAQENTDVKLGDVIAYIGEDAELASVQNAAPAKPVPQTVPQPVQAIKQQQQPAQAAPSVQGTAREVMAAPSVRRLAEQLGVDLSLVHGTGPHGRIQESDVQGFAAGKQPAKAAAPQSPTPAPQEGVERVALSQTRKAIARNMELSWTIPRASHMDLIDATALYNIVDREKKKAADEFGVKLTFLPFIIKATIEALKENPHFNASYDKDAQSILVKKYYNIGLAAEAPDGLKVVVIKDADKKNILELAKEIADLSAKVKAGTISLEEMRGSSFTITNIGSLGGGFLSVPMINYPDVAILGIHMLRDFPAVEDGKVVVGKVLPFSLVFDHRVVDGAEAVKFGNALIKYIEDPDFLEMFG